MAQENPYSGPWSNRKEPFHVLMLPVGVTIGTAKAAQYKRVPVAADNTWLATQDEAVTAVKDHWVVTVTKPGMTTQEEVSARQRDLNMEMGPYDKTKV